MGKFQGKMTWIVTLLAQMRKTNKQTKNCLKNPTKLSKLKQLLSELKCHATFFSQTYPKQFPHARAMFGASV